MRVQYFIDIIGLLLKRGATKTEIAKALGFKKQNFSEIFPTKPDDKPRNNLKDTHLPGLIMLCKKYKVGPQNGEQLLKAIAKEKAKK